MFGRHQGGCRVRRGECLSNPDGATLCGERQRVASVDGGECRAPRPGCAGGGREDGGDPRVPEQQCGLPCGRSLLWAPDGSPGRESKCASPRRASVADSDGDAQVRGRVCGCLCGRGGLCGSDTAVGCPEAAGRSAGLSHGSVCHFICSCLDPFCPRASCGW